MKNKKILASALVFSLAFPLSAGAGTVANAEKKSDEETMTVKVLNGGLPVEKALVRVWKNGKESDFDTDKKGVVSVKIPKKGSCVVDVGGGMIVDGIRVIPVKKTTTTVANCLPGIISLRE